jgi:hypothetical protein
MKFVTLSHFHPCLFRINQLPFSATRWKFHQHVYERLFRVNDKKLRKKKTNFTMLFVQKLCWLCHSQVALGCAGCTGCYSQVAISCAQKSFEKTAHKNVDEIDPWWQHGSQLYFTIFAW